MDAESVVVLVLFLGMILTGIGICSLCMKKCGRKNAYGATKEDTSTGALIPPVFYTDGLKDPLYQDDLLDK